jgi:ribosomal protein S18 acetylase RimI-like enzyme
MAVSVRSIGWRTDLELRRREGALVIEHNDHLEVRTPENPTYRWGNFLLITRPYLAGEAQRWIERFDAAFPDVSYAAIGLDGTAPDERAIAEFKAAGMSSEINAVLATDRPLTSSKPLPAGHELRPVRGERDWELAVELHVRAGEIDEQGFREFLEAHMRAIRHVCEQGHGSWWGAFAADGEMVCGLGIFDAGERIGRFQSVDTHPAHRRRGLASNLLVSACDHARAELHAGTLAIVADPDYFAIDIYRSLGFEERERMTQFESLSAPTSPAPAEPQR